MNAKPQGDLAQPAAGDDGRLRIRLSSRLYGREAVMAAAYRFTGKCIVQVETCEDGSYEVVFSPKADVCLSEVVGDYQNEIVDQQVRTDLEQRFGALRDTIVEHAFAPVRTEAAEKKTA